MNTSDTGSPSAAHALLALPSWRPGGELTPLEEQMRANAADGEPVSGGAGPFELADMKRWGDERVIRAAVLRYLLAMDDWPVDPRGARLQGVRIHGRLDLEGVTLRCTLRLAHCYLDADDPVCLDHAIAYRLTLTRCHLAGLTCDNLSAREVGLSGSTLTGSLRVSGADITGQLNCGGAQLTGNDNNGNTLVGDRMKVAGDVFLDQGFTAAGAIRLRSVRVGGSVQLRPAALAGTGNAALDAAGSDISGDLVWAPAGPVFGQVNLEGTSVGNLVDDWSKGRPAGFWPTGGRLRLDGFAYARFGGDQQATVGQRLDWIRSQYPSPRPKKPLDFATQPYEQLAKVYQQTGKDSDARKVAIARRVDLRRYGSLSWYRTAGNWFMDKTIKFGYQTWRATLGLAVVYVAFLVMTFVAQQHHAVVPVSDLVGSHPVAVATRCTSTYPCFYPIGYAVDVVIPVLNVHQADFWRLNGWGWVAGSWAATVLGWAGVTLLVVGYTGLVRQQ